MFDLICFVIGMVLFAAAIIGGISSRHNTQKCVSIILVGTFFASFALILPTTEVDVAPDFLTDVSYRNLTTMLYSLKVLSGRQSVSQIYDIALTGALRYIYISVCYIMFFTAPILSSTLLISFFGDVGEKIRYALHFSKKCYIFSDLNDNALSVSKGIRNSDKYATIVFCNTKESKKSLITKAKKLGGICFYKSCTDFHVGFFHRTYEFYLISDQEYENIKHAAKIIEKNNHVKQNKITVNAFAQSGIGIEIVESVNQKNVKVRFIDQVALLCNQIIYQNPLYDLPNGSKNISVMLVGCGRTGMQMLKTVVWSGQIDGYTLKICVYDNKALKIEQELYEQAPGLKTKEYDITFIETDINTPDFEDKVVENSLDSTYVFIATGDDELNLRTAAKLRSLFRRKTGRYDLMPKILTRVRDDFTTSTIKNSSYLTARNIDVFGNISVLFEDRLLFESKFEKLVLGVHLAYSDKLTLDPKSDAYQKICADFYANEYNRRSSMATALHISAKLRSQEVIAPNQYDLTNEMANDFEKKISGNNALVTELAKNEHTRWNAFFRSEGYLSADFEELKKYCHYNDDIHKDILSKTHPCITDWSELDNLAKTYDALLLTLPGKKKTVQNARKQKDPTDFKLHDIKIIKAIPEIIRFANRR